MGLGDKWMLYEMFKGNIDADAAMVESMDAEEVKEAVIEYFLMKGRE